MRLSMRGADYELRYRTFQRDLMRVELIVLSIILPISVAALLSQYCLLQREILYQPWPWTGLQPYSWSDVAKIETTCSQGGRGGWKGFFDVVMRDGARLEIAVPPFWSGGVPTARSRLSRDRSRPGRCRIHRQFGRREPWVPLCQRAAPPALAGLRGFRKGRCLLQALSCQISDCLQSLRQFPATRLGVRVNQSELERSGNHGGH